MDRRWFSVWVFLLAGTAWGLLAGCDKPISSSQSQIPAPVDTGISSSSLNMHWPTLPETGFTRGRVATRDDVASGTAVFAAFGSVTSDFLPIPIPQYALIRQKSGEKLPAILIQAETVHGDKGDVITYGLRMVENGSFQVAMPEEVMLLGVTRPSGNASR